jgi:hypothetical protein
VDQDKKHPATERGSVKGPYTQRSVRSRIEALFLDNVGKVLTREQIMEAAKDPKTGRAPENWHQRLSELRTDAGYTILSWRDRQDLRISEYLMPTAEKRQSAQRVKITRPAWKEVLRRANDACEWTDGGVCCALREGEIDPVGGGRVDLTPDHKRPHSVDPMADPADPKAWQALCGRHQVLKKNFWDHTTGKLNVYAIVQAAPERVKREIYRFLKEYFRR